MEPAKAELVQTKERTVSLETDISRVTDHLCSLNELVCQKLGTATELDTEIAALCGEVARLKPEDTEQASTPMRSVEELQAMLDDQIIQMEKKRMAIEERKAAIAKLSAHHDTQQAELAALAQQEAEQAARVDAINAARRKDTQKAAYNSQLTQLASWYTSLLSLHTQLTCIQRIDLVRPDYLLVAISGVPIHLNVCPATGKLKAAQVGSTSSTPKRQWKEIVETAVETNNIPYLIRQIHSALVK